MQTDYFTAHVYPPAASNQDAIILLTIRTLTTYRTGFVGLPFLELFFRKER